MRLDATVTLAVNPVPRPRSELSPLNQVPGVPLSYFISSCLTRDRARLKIRPLGNSASEGSRRWVRGTLDKVRTYAD
jgi:hypothetical protein